MTRFGRSRTQQSLDIDINDTKPIRKSSDDSMSSWRNSLVNSKMNSSVLDCRLDRRLILFSFFLIVSFVINECGGGIVTTLSLATNDKISLKLVHRDIFQNIIKPMIIH
ncbi:hypothetical protein WUBG_12809 [Wuchereria bancrofti]|uniref:Uncharacterized protein n=1 Tax=Wuchereria bancrofti TaxID=6293 RepID=J9E2A2_WUCBA|nr:hypothetical protein WUBG_12809 [Wuchereria bancrofti]